MRVRVRIKKIRFGAVAGVVAVQNKEKWEQVRLRVRSKVISVR